MSRLSFFPPAHPISPPHSSPSRTAIFSGPSFSILLWSTKRFHSHLQHRKLNWSTSQVSIALPVPSAPTCSTRREDNHEHDQTPMWTNMFPFFVALIPLTRNLPQESRDRCTPQVLGDPAIANAIAIGISGIVLQCFHWWRGVGVLFSVLFSVLDCVIILGLFSSPWLLDVIDFSSRQVLLPLLRPLLLSGSLRSVLEAAAASAPSPAPGASGTAACRQESGTRHKEGCRLEASSAPKEIEGGGGSACSHDKLLHDGWSLKVEHNRTDSEDRGIYFIDPEDKEFKETIKNARKKLGNANGSRYACKTSKNSLHGATRGKSNEIKSKLVCILEASESTRLRVGESLPNHHEDHIAGKGGTSLQH